MIFDTSIWVGLASGQISSQAVLKAAGDEQVYISAISLGELSFGVESCIDPAVRMLRTRYLRSLQDRPVLDVSSLTGSALGMLAACMKQSGRSPRTRVNDLWIAAQAIENDYALLTANLKDFEGLPGLRVACPSCGNFRKRRNKDENGLAFVVLALRKTGDGWDTQCWSSWGRTSKGGPPALGRE